MPITRRLNLILFIVACIACRDGFAAITIDSVRAKPSNCANDGSIVVFGRSPSPMLYALISGPEIRPVQSGNQFAALPSGNYIVRVTNFSNDTTLAPVTVGGTYTFPDFAPTFSQPACAGTATGIIAGNPLNAGTPPFSWSLTNLGTNTTITQASDSFYNIPAGSYSLRQFDSCQSFATRYLTIADPFHDFQITNLNNRPFTCDSVEIYLQIYLNGGNYAHPYTIQVQTPNGTYSHPINPSIFGGWYTDITERVGGVTYGDYCNITITDACGYSQHIDNTISPFNPSVNFAGNTDSCQPRFAGYFSISDQSDPTVRPTNMIGPVTVALYDPVTGAPVDSFVNPQYINGYFNYLAYTPYHAAGSIYTVRITDACNHSYTNTYVWPNLPPVAHNEYFTSSFCRDSSIGYSLYWENFFYSIPTFELLSGPQYVVSTKPHYQRTDTIRYPQNFIVYLGGASGTGTYGHTVEMANLGVGTYHYHIYDSCGHSITDSFTIRPQDVADLNYKVDYTRGCPGQNTLNLNHTSNAISYGVTLIQAANLNTISYYDLDTIRNLNSGTYSYQHNYYRSGLSVSATTTEECHTVFDNIVIPAYDLPKIDYATQVKCNGTVNVGLQPDSSKGIPPYTYEILSGPQTSTVQASNFFTLTLPGNYVARISDVCGFARTFSFSVDTLDFRQIVKIGSSCAGNTATLVAETSPYATYNWQRPNGTLYTGDSLHISPVTPADYGIYNITKIVSVNACRDTFYATYNLTSSSINYTTASICPGGSVVFDGRTLTLAGTYYDTIPGAQCDSIVALTLSIATPAYDSISVSICTGQSVTVGSHTYTTTGLYRDTLTTTTGCDSIHILNLVVSAYLQDSIQRTICSGQSVTLGTKTYSATGIYRDTLQGINGGCDSIHILNLTVNAYKRDSVAQFICYGQSVTVGTHTYTATGIYRDTLTTNTCDSIHILNLQVGQQKRDSASVSICSGQSITIGTNTYAATGIYRDTFNVNGCDSVFVLNLQVGPYKTTTAIQTICEGNSITIGTNTYTAAGIYRDTFATATCDSIYILNLTVSPIVRTTQTLTICNGQSVTIGANTYNATGTYTDTLATQTGCDSIHTLNLLVLSATYDSLSVAFCEGESKTIGHTTYTSAGNYTDTLTGSYGCDSIVKITVTTYARPVLQVSASDSSVEYSDTVRLTATGNNVQAYFWQGNAVFDNAFSPTPLATITEPGWLVAMATSADNCTTSDSVYVAITDCNEAIFLPNAFTPNGDGQNDIFKVLSRCVTMHSFRIFNRWGELVYETSDINQGWDGTFKGAAQMPGVYVYTVAYFANSAMQQQARLLKGSVSLIR